MGITADFHYREPKPSVNGVLESAVNTCSVAVGEGAWTNEQARCYVERRADKDERVGIRFSISERDGEMAPAPAEPRPGLLDSFFTTTSKMGCANGFFTSSS